VPSLSISIPRTVLYHPRIDVDSPEEKAFAHFIKEIDPNSFININPNIPSQHGSQTNRPK